ncbi:hypothetical protein HYPSUDRAFT_203033 [Hypholoma sublateritium FD-334 SS-4]|uniref:Uncharacterized protein n=1 Tax=Hypholoma sublateritium (strain FD-334 SS-4) TaxID=945553 RepID=A0A0D2MCR1_HYPSF|nr:hypothetical protein HYPSUDRAFT_203033 [Hypholoma sublateritium FD-334 SS-4]
MLDELKRERDLIIEEKDAPICALEEQLAQLRDEFDGEKQQRAAEDAEFREREQRELAERNDFYLLEFSRALATETVVAFDIGLLRPKTVGQSNRIIVGNGKAIELDAAPADLHCTDDDPVLHWTVRLYDTRDVQVATMHVYGDDDRDLTIEAKVSYREFLYEDDQSGRKMCCFCHGESRQGCELWTDALEWREILHRLAMISGDRDSHLSVDKKQFQMHNLHAGMEAGHER